MEITLRALTVADAAAFKALRLRGYREHPALFAYSHDEEVDRPLADTERDLQPAGGGVVVGAFAPGLVAVAGLRADGRRKRSHRLHLHGVYVAPEARGRGLARTLVTELLQRARTAGTSQIILTVMSANESAIALYHALGFERYGRAPRAMVQGGTFHDEDLMFLDLDVDPRAT